jgi:predicted DCC family thiol-disulfide oxidoreductase YuxK
VLVFDGECTFCRVWVERWRRSVEPRVGFVAYQDVGDAFPEVSRQAFSEAVHLIEPDGRVSRGAEAVFRTLAHDPRRRWLYTWYRRLPGAAPICEWGYQRVARNRRVASWLTRRLMGPDGDANAQQQ